jgi:hypothetical protein
MKNAWCSGEGFAFVKKTGFFVIGGVFFLDKEGHIAVGAVVSIRLHTSLS